MLHVARNAARNRMRLACVSQRGPRLGRSFPVEVIEFFESVHTGRVVEAFPGGGSLPIPYLRRCRTQGKVNVMADGAQTADPCFGAAWFARSVFDQLQRAVDGDRAQ